MTKTLMRWLVCRGYPWPIRNQPARHDWYGWPELGYPLFVCLRCDYRVGPGPV